MFWRACAPGATAGQCDPIQPEWAGQEATAFPDNWTIGMSFYHNVFAREHNAFVDEFRKQARTHAERRFGSAQPGRPAQVITYREVTPDELFEVARLVVAAEIAKIHTIEWTTQLLYDEPLYRGMNANWSGLFAGQVPGDASGSRARLRQAAGSRDDAKDANVLVLGARRGTGIIATGAEQELVDEDTGTSPTRRRERRRQPFRVAVQLSRGVHHGLPAAPAGAGSDRVPRDRQRPEPDPQQGAGLDTFRGKATAQMHDGGLATGR